MAQGRPGWERIRGRVRGRGPERRLSGARPDRGPHRGARLWGPRFAAALLAGLALETGCLLPTEGLGETAPVETGGGGSGVGGGPGECERPEDCPGEDADCRQRSCIDHICVLQDAPLLTACDDDGGRVCDGAGRCLLALGDPCDSGEQCLSNHCADGNCCTTACEGGCEICAGTNPPGTCAPYVGGDPELACDGGVCDGSGGCARGELLWRVQFGGFGAVVNAWGVAADEQGNVVVAGDFAGDTYFGSRLLESNGDQDGFLAKLDPSGEVLWLKELSDDGDDDDQRALDVAMAPNGDVVVVGDFVGSIRLGSGGGLLSSLGDKDGFVASFTAGGTFNWGRSIGADDEDRTRRVAVGPDGQVLVTGDFRSETVTVGTTQLTNAGAGDTDLYLASLTIDGEHGWAASFGDAVDQCPVDWACTEVAVGADGSILLAGSILGQVDLGGGALGDSSGFYSGFLGKLQSDGAHFWSESFADGTHHRGVNAVAFASPALAWITGNYWGDLALGGSCALPTAEGSGSDVYFASFDVGAAGSCQYAYAHRAPLNQAGLAATTDALGNLALAGRYQAAPTVEGTTWPYGTLDSVFLLKRSDAGGPLWSHGFASGYFQDARALAARPDRSLVMVGSFQSTFDLDTPASSLGPMTAAGATDAFVAAFEP